MTHRCLGKKTQHNATKERNEGTNEGTEGNEGTQQRNETEGTERRNRRNATEGNEGTQQRNRTAPRNGIEGHVSAVLMRSRRLFEHVGSLLVKVARRARFLPFSPASLGRKVAPFAFFAFLRRRSTRVMDPRALTEESARTQRVNMMTAMRAENIFVEELLLTFALWGEYLQEILI